MNFVVEPHQGVGPIRFGMTSCAIKEALGDKVWSFPKSTDSADTADAFPDIGVHVHYKSSGGCEAVEFGGSVVPLLFGTPLLGTPFYRLCAWIFALDPEAELNETGLTSKRLGFGISMTSVKDLEQTPDGVIIFAKGYCE